MKPIEIFFNIAAIFLYKTASILLVEKLTGDIF